MLQLCATLKPVSPECSTLNHKLEQLLQPRYTRMEQTMQAATLDTSQVGSDP